MSGPAPVYVEVSPLVGKRVTGIGRFTARLIEALAHVTTVRLFTALGSRRVSPIEIESSTRYGREIAVGAGDVAGADADLERWAHALLHRPGEPLDAAVTATHAAIYPWLRPGRRHFRREISVLHDFTPLLFAWAHIPQTLKDMGRYFGTTIALSDAALAVSHATKADARWLSVLPEDAVVAAHPGASLCVRTHVGPAAPRRPNRIVVVSTLEPRKNGRFLLDWFSTTDVLPAETELWWAGPQGWLSEVSRLRRRGHARRVRFLGMVPDAELCTLYREAAFTIYPSLYEGFGFPVLDSLRHGAPVLASFNSSLQEFAGPGVFYFDACDPRSLDAACRALLASRVAPPSQAELDARYSWDVLAATMLRLCA